MRRHRLTASFVGGFALVSFLLTFNFSTFAPVDYSDDAMMDRPYINSLDDGVHVIYGVSGSSRTFFSELEISMKSVLMNAPLHDDLTIHIMADGKGYAGIGKVINNITKLEWRSRNQINIQVYPVQNKVKAWEKNFLVKVIGFYIKMYRHTIGSYFRLFAFDVIPSTVHHAIYLDSDVLILAPLDELWKHRDPNVWFQWGLTQRTAGFIILDVQKCGGIWGLLPDYNGLKAYKKNGPWGNNLMVGDQLLLRIINHTHPELVGSLPVEWENNRAAYWGKLDEHRPNGVGVMHFNGGGMSNINALDAREEKMFSERNHYSGWGTGRYFSAISWEWAKHVSQSHIPPGSEGFLLKTNYSEIVRANDRAKTKQ